MVATPGPRSSALAGEAALAARWAAGLAGPLRLEDGRSARVVFPGVPGGSSGPDFRGAILDAAGDLLRGDVEVHLRASGWHAHGHFRDEAYAGVVLHLVAVNDSGQPLTAHNSGRLIPLLVAPPAPAGVPLPFTPPCALRAARGGPTGPVLERLGLRRLRMKAARAAPLAASGGPGQALYQLLLETLAGPSNREPFGAIARTLPLAALLEMVEATDAPRAFAITAHLKGRGAGIVLRRAGIRPMASPGRRLEAAGALFARLWPSGAAPGWPLLLSESLPGSLVAPGVGRALAIECSVNAVLPVALATGILPEREAEALWIGLPSPGIYGKLRRLDGWLAGPGSKPFSSAARLQGGLLLHTDYCTKGHCGRCPLSS